MTDADASALVSRRSGGGFCATDTAWVNEVMGNRAGLLAQFITGQSYQFSAILLAVSSDGRAFRRVRIVVDASDETAAPHILFRRDLTDRGWPLDPAILTSLREGNWSRQTF